MINGVYKVYKDNTLVAESENAVTNFGRDTIVKFLCGSVPSWGDAVAIGCSKTTPTAASNTNSTLDFEFSRSTVNVKSPSITVVSQTASSGTSGAYTHVVSSATGIVVGMQVSGTGIGSNAVVTNVSSTTITTSVANSGTVSGTITYTLRKMVLKATFDPSVSGEIKEIGVYSSLNGTTRGLMDARILTMFDEGLNASGATDPLLWRYDAAASSTSTNSKVGTANIAITATGTAVATILGSTSLTPSTPGYLNLDISSYDRNATINLAYTALTTNAATIVVTLYDNQNTPQTLTWTISHSAGTNGSQYIASSTLSALTDSGSFNYNISAIKISTTQSTSFDAVRIDNTDITDNTFGLVSRSVLGSAVTVAPGESLDIQYEMVLGI